MLPLITDAIVARLKYSHFPYPIEVLKSPHAGHRAGQPDIDLSWQGALPHPVSGRVVTSGGTPEGNAQASLDAIPRVLEFLRTNLAATHAAHEATCSHRIILVRERGEYQMQELGNDGDVVRGGPGFPFFGQALGLNLFVGLACGDSLLHLGDRVVE